LCPFVAIEREEEPAMKRSRKTLPWFTKGDLDGFFGLGLDNLIQFILISVLCQQVLDMPVSFLVTRIFPGAAVSILFGNIFYAWQARSLAQRTGRTDVTALPYGINTVSLIAFILFIMHPVYQETGNLETAWKVGMLACLLSGLIELIGSLVADHIRRITPRAALLSALAGIAVTFISMDFLFKIFARPDIAMVPMAIILAQYFARIRYPFGIPGGLLAILVGTVLFWWLGSVPADEPGGVHSPVSLSLPRPAVGELWEVMRSGYFFQYLSIIIPMGLLNVVGSLQNIESAEAGGDAYPTVQSLAVNGAGSILASLLGSCFPTTIYIGHPGWKAMGARSGYSLLNAASVGLICFSGTVLWILRIIPLEAGIGILLWIGIVICAQAFQVTPRAHAPAVAFGLFPSLAAWGSMMLEEGLRRGGSSFHRAIAESGNLSGLPYQGVLSLSQGFLFTSMIFAAMAVFLIERKFLRASLWAMVAAGFSYFGLIHAFEVVEGGVLPHIGWGTASVYAANYLLFAVFFLGIHGWEKARRNHGDLTDS